MPNKTLFRTNGASLLNTTSTSSTKRKKRTQHSLIATPGPTSTSASWTESALKKANMAVLYDNKGSLRQALEAYNEAIALLNKVFESSVDCSDSTRLRKIYDSYVDRVSVLTHYYTDNPLGTATTTIKASQRPLPPPPSISTDEHHASHTSLYSTSSESHPSSLFVKKHPSKDQLQSATLSKSAPSLSTNKLFVSWRKLGSKPKHQGTSDLDRFEFESTLPKMELTEDVDYFDLESTMETKHMLYSTPAHMLKSMYDLHNTESFNENEESGLDEDHIYNTPNKTYITKSATPSLTLTLSPSTSTSSDYNPHLASSASSIMTSSSSFSPSIYSPTQSVFYPKIMMAIDGEYDCSLHCNPLISSESSSINDEPSLLDGLIDKSSTIPSEPTQPISDTLTPPIMTVSLEGTSEQMSLSATTTSSLNEPNTQYLYAQKQQTPSLLSRSMSTKNVSSTISQASGKKTKHYSLAAPALSNDITRPITFWPKQRTIALPAIHIDHSTNKSLLPSLLSPNSISASMNSSIVSPTPHDTYIFDTDIPPVTKSKVMGKIETTINFGNQRPNLMTRLLQSMTEGGYITDRVHAPRQLWHQTHIRLPAIETKVSTCEQMITVLQRMQDITRLFHQHHLDHRDITDEALYLLDKLDHLLDNSKHICSRITYDFSATTATQGKLEHPRPKSSMHVIKDPLNAWSNKLSKSVDRIKTEIKPSDDQLGAYISTLIRLFTIVTIIDEWRTIFLTLVDTASVYPSLLQKTQHCNEMLHTVLCGFVMQDFAILLNKWLKRNREWLLEGID